MTTKLRTGSVTIDLVDAGIYGDLDHCPKDGLLESAETLLSLLPRIRHKGLWGLRKAYDTDCYICTTNIKYRVPEGLEPLPSDINKGPIVGDPEACRRIPDRPFSLRVLSSSRGDHWKGDWYSRVIGSVKDGHASPDTEGVPDHYRKPEYTNVDTGTGATAASREADKPKPELVQQKLF